MKVPELKNYLQVRGISVARELAIEIIKEQRDQISISVKLVTDDGTIPRFKIPDPYSLKSDWT